MTMIGWLLAQRITLLALILWIATGLSYVFGHGDGIAARQVVDIVVLLVAAFKVRIVILDFMEVRHAPLPLRLGCEAWLVAVTAILIGFALVR